jgi:hypothetical protein
MAPRQSGLTFTPVRPSVRYSTLGPYPGSGTARRPQPCYGEMNESEFGRLIAYPETRSLPVTEVARVAIGTRSSSFDGSFKTADGVDLLSVLGISSAEAGALGRVELVERLADRGWSRLTAERVAELHFEAAEPGRARFHSHARR